MNDSPGDFDLKFTPDWLKDIGTGNPYGEYEARHAGERERERRADRGGAGGGMRRDREGRARPPGPPGRGPRREDSQSRGERRPGPPGGARARERDRNRDRDHDRARGKPDRPPGGDALRPAREDLPPAPVKIEFFPDPACVASIAKQIKATGRAYSLFDLARMFLARPERHRVRISSTEENSPLHQAGDEGPVALDRQAAERAAFDAQFSQFYVEENIQRDPPKGNFTNVARHRLSGVLLGPTNHHGYQLARRKLYEERYSRRMSFADFQRDIDVVTDPGLVEQWREQARTVRVFRTQPAAQPQEPQSQSQSQRQRQTSSDAREASVDEPPAEPASSTGAGTAADLEMTPASTGNTSGAKGPGDTLENGEASASAGPEPGSSAPVTPADSPQPQETEMRADEVVTFASLAEVEGDFRERHLAGVMRSRRAVEISGTTSQALPDRRIAAAVRQAWEKERGYPGQMMHHLRQGLSREGLQIFKHHKRMQFVSTVRPEPFSEGARQSVSPTIAEILRLVSTTPKCTRTTLAVAMLGPEGEQPSPEAGKRKAALASDLRWLIDAGRVIEFYDGTLELPVTRGEKEKEKETERNAGHKAREGSSPAAAAPAEAAAATAPAARALAGQTSEPMGAAPSEQESMEPPESSSAATSAVPEPASNEVALASPQAVSPEQTSSEVQQVSEFLRETPIPDLSAARSEGSERTGSDVEESGSLNRDPSAGQSKSQNAQETASEVGASSADDPRNARGASKLG